MGNKTPHKSSTILSDSKKKDEEMTDEEIYICAQSDKLDLLKEYTREAFEDTKKDYNKSEKDREVIHQELKGIREELGATRESNQRIFSLWETIDPTLREIAVFMAVKNQENGTTKQRMDEFNCSEEKLDEKVDNLSLRVEGLESSVQLLIRIMAIVMPIVFTIILAIQGVILYTLFNHLSTKLVLTMLGV